MSLINDIAEIVADLYPDSNFKFLSEFRTNEEAFFSEISEMPLIVLNNNILKNAEIKQNNNVIKDTRIEIYILKLDDNSYDEKQRENLRSECEIVGDRIAVNIYQKLNVRPAGNQKYILNPEFNAFASNMTGVRLQMNVNYNEIINFK
jgi:hypothetical protein